MRLPILALACFAAANIAHAQDKEEGPYLGVSIGSFDYEEASDELDVTFSDSALAYRLVGGYRVSENLAIEGGWGKTSDLKDSFVDTGSVIDIKANYDLKTIRVLGLIPLSSATLLGGIGYYDADLDLTATLHGTNLSVSDSSSDNGATLVGGIQFDRSRVTIRAEYEWFDTDSDVDAWDISLSALFRF